MAIKKEEIAELLKKLNIKFEDDAKSEELEALLREYILNQEAEETVPLKLYDDLNTQVESISKELADVKEAGILLEQDLELEKAKTELLQGENKDLKELAVNQKAQVEKVMQMQSQPIVFWAFANNRTEFLSALTFEGLQDSLKLHPQLKDSELFVANKFSSIPTVPDDEYLKALIANTFGRIEDSKL